MNKSISDGCDCRTAPATPGLLITENTFSVNLSLPPAIGLQFVDLTIKTSLLISKLNIDDISLAITFTQELCRCVQCNVQCSQLVYSGVQCMRSEIQCSVQWGAVQCTVGCSAVYSGLQYSVQQGAVQCTVQWGARYWSAVMLRVFMSVLIHHIRPGVM